MKLLFALFAATVATAAADGVTTAGSAADLATRWDMADEPDITYDSATNTFTIDYLEASGFGEYQEEFYDVNCKDDGSGFPENVVSQYFTDAPTGSGRPKMYTNDEDRPGLSFIIDTQAAAADPLIYEVVGEVTDSCMGQYYDLTATITVNANSAVFIDQHYDAGASFPFTFNVVRKDSGDTVYASGDIPVNFSTGTLPIHYLLYTVTKRIQNLCRDTEYDFVFTHEEGNNFFSPTVTISYDSPGTQHGFNNVLDWVVDQPYPNPNLAEFPDDIMFQKSISTTEYSFTEEMNLAVNPQNPVTNLDGKDGLGMMKFCVRGGIGYNEDDANDALLANPETSLADALANGYQEVNFIESLITIFYNLTAGFDVDEFNVDPKERVETTAAKEAYGLEAWLCESGSTDDDFFEETWGRIAPAKISDNYLVGATTPEYFNQGALITVCVAPVELAFSDGIRMAGITSFEWKRDDFADVFVTNPDSELSTDAITQPAIVGGEASANLLTSYIKDDCELNAPDYCRFSSILFADFYITTGAVSGSGNAKLVFGSRRRLGESLSRQLQADEGGDSPFDLQVPVDITDTGPAGLKTAAGVSFAASTFAMAVALIGAALLA